MPENQHSSRQLTKTMAVLFVIGFAAAAALNIYNYTLSGKLDLMPLIILAGILISCLYFIYNHKGAQK